MGFILLLTVHPVNTYWAPAIQLAQPPTLDSGYKNESVMDSLLMDLSV